MTSKDELRLQVGQKLHDYGVRGQDNDYLTDYILNLLEDEKQKAVDDVLDELLEWHEVKTQMSAQPFNWYGAVKALKISKDHKKPFNILHNKEPNKGEDVDG